RRPAPGARRLAELRRRLRHGRRHRADVRPRLAGRRGGGPRPAPPRRRRRPPPAADRDRRAGLAVERVAAAAAPGRRGGAGVAMTSANEVSFELERFEWTA